MHRVISLSLPIVVALALVAASARADGPIQPGQGTRIHATGPLEYVNIPLDSARRRLGGSLTLKRGELRVEPFLFTNSCEGNCLNGRTFYAPLAGELVKLTIRAVADFSPSTVKYDEAPRHKYRVTWKFPGTHSHVIERQLCDTTGNWALAVPGAWTLGGELLNNDKFFTFACLPEGELGGGVSAKCIDWGMPPWPAKHQSDPDTALKFHQICVRMAMADYCGEGRTNTLDGTPIAFERRGGSTTSGEPGAVNETGPQTPSKKHLIDPPAASEIVPVLRHEAIWAIDNKGTARATCLSEERRASLSLDATCINTKKIDPDNCKMALQLDDLGPGEPRLISYSTLSDKMLVTFKDSEGRFLTTAQTNVVQGATEKYVPNANTGTDLNGFEQYLPEGIIFTSILDIIKDLRPELTAIYRCPNTNDRGWYLDTNSSAGSDAKCEREGYIFKPDTSMPKGKPLHTWQHDEEFVTSTLPPSEDQFSNPKLLGYLPVRGEYSTLADHSQAGWHRCSKCQGLFFSNGSATGKCSAGGNHAFGDSYLLDLNNPSAPGQRDWRLCSKCKGLFYGPNQESSKCPADRRKHDFSGSGYYTVSHRHPHPKAHEGWRRCKECQGLFYYNIHNHNASKNNECPAGGSHVADTSMQYDIYKDDTP